MELSRGMKYTIAAVAVGVMGMLAVMLVAICVLGYMVYNNQNVGPAPQPAPVVVVADTIETILADHNEDAAKLAALHRAMSDVIGADTGVIKTTNDIRQANSMAGRLCLGDSLKDKHKGLSEALEAKIVAAIGKESRTLTPELRKAASAAFNQMADAEEKAAE